MNAVIERPSTVQINAWNDAVPNSDRLPAKTPWAQQAPRHGGLDMLAPAPPADLRDWRHPDVGWGLILPDNDDLSQDAKVAAEDAPAPIRKLLKARPGSPVLRWSPALDRYHLRRYYADGQVQDLSTGAPDYGVGFEKIPRYLLIYGTPVAIPWSLQYVLNLSNYVGRLDLTEEEGLDHYIDALIAEWDNGACRARAPLMWSVDHGADDITWLMQRAVADALWNRFASDADMTGRVRLKGDDATRDAIAATLEESKPGLVVTTSHGMTSPLGDSAGLLAQLGMPVDAKFQPLRSADLGRWKPSGAIWYAHACCSAGSDSASRYATLMPADSNIGRIINGVASTAGAVVAPLPRALLGGAQPLRAFVGHVEPTFDWTLRDPDTGQVLTPALCNALYTELFQQNRLPTPIGYALRGVFKESGNYFGVQDGAIARINANVPGQRDWALHSRLVAMDRQTLVIIGDPTVALPRFG